MTESVSVLVDRIAELRAVRGFATVLVAIDGASGAGKSTFALKVGLETEASVIDGDDFYAGGSAEIWDAMSPAEKAAHCIDWRRQRTVLQALAKGEPAIWHPYDWDTDDGRLAEHPVFYDPAPVIILEGVYSARPELADLLDLRVLFDAPREVRQQRMAEREGADYRTEWNNRWEEAEQWYFSQVMPPDAFDLVLPAEDS